MEAYCADPQCDCRRVMLNVIDAERHDNVASINYAFEPPFEGEGQMFLDPLNPQSAMSPAFLELTADMMAHDRAYHDRLVRHYTMWKRSRFEVRMRWDRRACEEDEVNLP